MAAFMATEVALGAGLIAGARCAKREVGDVA